MNFFAKSKLIKFLSVFLCLNLLIYSTLVPAVNYSYATDVCDPEDDDYEECVAEQERERQEEEEEDRRDAAKERLEQEREAKEALIEEHEDDPSWIAPWLITPTPAPTTSVTKTPETTAANQQTGEGSTNTTKSNSASQIDVKNINTTTLEEEVNVISNTGNNIICQDCSPQVLNKAIINNEEKDDLTDSILNPGQITQGNLGKNHSDSNKDGSNQVEGASTPEDAVIDAQGESFSESEEETSHKAGGDQTEDDFTTDASGENFSSGKDANQMSVSEDIDELTAYNANDLDLVNEVEVDSTSGENELSENEDNADLETGAGQSSAMLENYGNINATETNGAEGVEAVNEETGDDSVSFTSDEVSDTIKVENKNHAAVENNLSVSSNSGENELSENEGDATLTTGEVEIIANLLNILNLNITGKDFTHLIVNIFGNLTGEFDLDDIAEKYLEMDEDDLIAIAKNTGTGENSENTAIAKNSETLDVNNKNEAAVINNVDVEGVTGKNELSENEDNVNLVTGRIKILTSILNFINANFSGTDWYFAMINIFGGLTGDILLPNPDQFLFAQDCGVEAINSQTGDDSQNQALASKTEAIGATNENAAEVKNIVNATGDSGSNQALANEDETQMETGEVNVAANIMNWLNYNIFGNRWVMVVVNVFGRWLGRIIAFPGKGDIDAPESGTLVAVAGGEEDAGPTVVAENEETGEDSDNFAQSSSETNMNVNNENKAYVENNVNVEGVSGQNETNGNEDQVNIVTGWIDIGVNLINLVNFNVTGRQWMLLIVNVFGDFFGNIVFPHEEPEAPPQVLAENGSSSADEFNFQAEEELGGEEGTLDEEETLGGLGEEVASGDESASDEDEVSGGEEGLDNDNANNLDEDFDRNVSENFSQPNDSKDGGSNGEVIILTLGGTSGNQQNLITKSLRSFIFAGAKVKGQSLDDEEDLDKSLTNSYNQDSVEEDSTHNESEEVDYQGRSNFPILFLKIVRTLTALFKKFLAQILKGEK